MGVIVPSRAPVAARGPRNRAGGTGRAWEWDNGRMSTSSFSRPGAVDLSQLAARAKAAAAPAPAAPGPGAPAGGASYVLESSEQTFESDAIRPSTQHPVVVELYSPRVASGQQLSDALAAVANASEGRFLLVRLDVDTAPGIVQALQLQAVPTVLAIISGQAVPLFQGVLPPDQVQQAVDQVLKTAIANGMVGRAQPVAPGAGGADAGAATRSTRAARPAVRRRRRGARRRGLRRRARRVRPAAPAEPERHRGRAGQGAGRAVRPRVGSTRRRR